MYPNETHGPLRKLPRPLSEGLVPLRDVEPAWGESHLPLANGQMARPNIFAPHVPKKMDGQAVTDADGTRHQPRGHANKAGSLDLISSATIWQMLRDAMLCRNHEGTSQGPRLVRARERMTGAQG